MGARCEGHKIGVHSRVDRAIRSASPEEDTMAVERPPELHGDVGWIVGLRKSLNASTRFPFAVFAADDRELLSADDSFLAIGTDAHSAHQQLHGG